MRHTRQNFATNSLRKLLLYFIGGTPGATGVTILEGHGLHRLQKKFEIRGDLPLIPSLESLLRGKEIDTHFLVSVVDDDLATRLKAETVAILGDLTLPGNGLILSLDIADILGLRTD